MGKSFAEMQEMYKGIVKRFNKIELQDWKAEGAMIELSKQVGELAKQVMIKEKYYALTGDVPDVDEKLGNEMADVIAQVMRLAEYYSIDLEKAFIEAREDEDRYLQSRGV
jgi:NTP pyrophosphatase (non-canonical NTP hydrolase)